MPLRLRVALEVNGKVSEIDLSRTILEFKWRLNEYEGRARLSNNVLEIIVEKFPLRLLANPAKAISLLRSMRDFADALSRSLGVEVRIRMTENLALISSRPNNTQ